MFKDRAHAGQLLATALQKYAGACIVLGLARGGVVVAAEVARGLNVPLGVVVPRKLGAPHNPELAIGAVMPDGEMYLNAEVMRDLGVTREYVEEVKAKEQARAETRRRMYGAMSDVAGSTVLLVDDGIATGSTMFASIQSVKKRGARCVVVAVPVGPPETLEELKRHADDVVCLDTHMYGAISMSYENFSPVEDKDVIALLH